MINLKKYATLSVLAIASMIIFSSCAEINLSKIKYDSERDLYYYYKYQRNLILRNDSSKVVRKENFHDFLYQLSATDLQYNFEKCLEKDLVLANSDFQLEKQYSLVQTMLNENKYKEALDYTGKAETLYPSLIYFSDFSFLKALAYERLQISDSALTNYKLFLDKSGQKYSARFNGYVFADTENLEYISERVYALNYAQNRRQINELPQFKPIIPKYYYDSFSQGFVSNTDDYAYRKNTLFTPLIGTDFNKNLILGIGAFRRISMRTYIFPYAYYSNGSAGISAAMPIQLYQQQNNFRGIKLSPIISFSYVKYIRENSTNVNVNSEFFNFGAKLSARQFLNQKFSIGSHYLYYFFNGRHKYNLSNNHYIWNSNEFDVSLYYHMIKGYSLRGSLINGSPAIGLQIAGLILQYKIKNQQLGLVFERF
jgi:hypothetical protein